MVGVSKSVTNGLTQLQDLMRSLPTLGLGPRFVTQLIALRSTLQRAETMVGTSLAMLDGLLQTNKQPTSAPASQGVIPEIQLHGKRAVTQFIHPPIPKRQYDWEAHFDGDEPNDQGWMLKGYGPTEVEALIDLLQEYSIYHEV